MNYYCPVCGFGGLTEPPANFSICPCCGTEFEYDNFFFGYEALRNRWIANGAQWFAADEWPTPQHWNAFIQLMRAGLVTRISGADTNSKIMTYRVQGQGVQSDKISMILTSTSTFKQFSVKAA